MFELIRDVVDLFVAGAKFPADACDEQQCIAYLGNMVSPASGVMSGAFKLFHKHAKAMDALLACSDAEVEALVVKAVQDKVEGWEQLIPIILPFALKLLEWFRNRRKDQPKPAPDPFNV